MSAAGPCGGQECPPHQQAATRFSPSLNLALNATAAAIDVGRSYSLAHALTSLANGWAENRLLVADKLCPRQFRETDRPGPMASGPQFVRSGLYRPDQTEVARRWPRDNCRLQFAEIPIVSARIHRRLGRPRHLGLRLYPPTESSANVHPPSGCEDKLTARFEGSK